MAADSYMYIIISRTAWFSIYATDDPLPCYCYIIIITRDVVIIPIKQIFVLPVLVFTCMYNIDTLFHTKIIFIICTLHNGCKLMQERMPLVSIL